MTRQMRYPAVPLVVHDPFFSVWSFSDRLTESWSCHWGGADSRLSGILRIDGRSLRFAGPDGGEAMEQAYAALFFATDECRYCTGAILPVDGGQTCGPMRPEE